MSEIEKKYKESKRESEVLEVKIKTLNSKIDEYVFNERKREEEVRKLKKERELSLS